MYSPIRLTQGNEETQALLTENCHCQMQEKLIIIIKEEGSKEEDRQEEADVKKIVLRMDTQI